MENMENKAMWVKPTNFKLSLSPSPEAIDSREGLEALKISKRLGIAASNILPEVDVEVSFELSEEEARELHGASLRYYHPDGTPEIIDFSTSNSFRTESLKEIKWEDLSPDEVEEIWEEDKDDPSISHRFIKVTLDWKKHWLIEEETTEEE